MGCINFKIYQNNKNCISFHREDLEKVLSFNLLKLAQATLIGVTSTLILDFNSFPIFARKNFNIPMTV